MSNLTNRKESKMNWWNYSKRVLFFIVVNIFFVLGGSISVSFSQTILDTLQKPAADTIVIEKNKSEIDAPINYTAQDSINFSIADKKVYLYGGAVVTFKNIELKANYIEFDIDKTEVYASGMADTAGVVLGKPVFKEGNEVFNTDTMYYNFKTKKGLIYGVVTQESDGYLHSEVTKKQENGDIHIAGGKYTTCDAEHPHFYIALTKAIVKPKQKIISGPCYFVIEDIPLPFIGLPFGYFPAKKGSAMGILIPSYGEDRDRGFFLRNGGFYLPINDHIDFAVQSEIYSKGTIGFNARSRYKWMYQFDGDFEFQYRNVVTSEKGLADYNKRKSYSIRWSHRQDSKSNPNSNFTANVNFETNSFNKYNATNHENLLSTQKSSSVSYRKSWPNSPFNLTANLQASQNTETHQVTMDLPVVNLNMNTIYPFKRKESVGEQKWYEQLSVGYSSNFKNYLKTNDSTLFNQSTINGLQTGYQHSIPVSLPIKLGQYFTLSPSLNYNGMLNTKSVEKHWERQYIRGTDTLENQIITDTIIGLKYAHQYETSISLSFNQRWYGTYEFTPSWIRNKIKAIRHVITPQISFSYKPKSFVNDSKYYQSYYTDKDTVRYSIFDGVGVFGTPGSSDRSGSVSFSLGNNIEMKIKDRKDTTGEFKIVKILESLNFNTNYSLFKDSLNWSDISVNGGTRIFENINVQFSGSFDPYAHDKQGKQINKLAWEAGESMLLRNSSLSLGMNYQPKTTNNGTPVDKNKRPDFFDPFTLQYVDFSIPWTVSISYSLNFSNTFNTVKEKYVGAFTQSIRFSGNLSITPKWKVTYSSGYDFEMKKFVATSFGMSRDLHCWEMSFNWIPYGRIQSYNFRINIKSAIFEGVEYKIDKRNYGY